MGMVGETAPKSFEDMAEDDVVQETASESTDEAKATTEDEQ